MTQTSNATAIKAAVIAALADAPGLSGVDIAYSWNRDMGRECVYAGAVSVQQSISSGRDPEGNASRSEIATINFHVRVGQPGDSVEEAETRAVEIGAVLEAFLALHMPDVPGLLAMEVQGFDLASAFDDDGGFAMAIYPVRAESYLS